MKKNFTQFPSSIFDDSIYHKYETENKINNKKKKNNQQTYNPIVF
jgi:hypothetical protein